jgi:hypothetical protein
MMMPSALCSLEMSHLLAAWKLTISAMFSENFMQLTLAISKIHNSGRKNAVRNVWREAI